MSDLAPKRNLSRPPVLLITVVLVLSAGLATLLIYLAVARSSNASAVSDTQTYRGTDYLPPLELQDFTLTDQTRQPVSLSDLAGNAVLLLFGFTNCPDVCPLTLVEFKQAKTLLGEQAERVKFVLISVDSERDTPEVLAEYIGNFDSEFIALSSDDTRLREVGQDFGMEFERVESETENGESAYTMEHTARSYLIDPEGKLRVVFSYGTDAEILAERTREILQEFD